jgi:hypothetical protein
MQVVPNRLMGWIKQVEAYVKLFDAASAALDVSRILDTELFSCWAPEQREFWRPLFRELYWTCNHIHERVKILHRVLRDCENKVKAFLAVPVNQRSQEQIAELEKHMRHLSQLISALPQPLMIENFCSE